MDSWQYVAAKNFSEQRRVCSNRLMVMRTSEAPYCTMLSRQQMASFSVHRIELDGLTQQSGTKMKRSLGDWAQLDGRDA